MSAGPIVKAGSWLFSLYEVDLLIDSNIKNTLYNTHLAVSVYQYGINLPMNIFKRLSNSDACLLYHRTNKPDYICIFIIIATYM